jgi:hypothetical protein
MPYRKFTIESTGNFPRIPREDYFRPRPGAAKECRARPLPAFAAGTLRAFSAAGRRYGGFRGRGRVAGEARRFSQRVVVKSRSVRHRGRSVKALLRHVHYLQREGVGLAGDDPKAFGSERELNREEVRLWAESAAGDRHHFRFIVSPENGNELDLRKYARELVKQMEWDLRTRLEWIGVTHHNTDNPHVHILIRGVDERGRDLVINRDYICRGVRETAQSLATRELGFRSELDVRKSIEPEPILGTGGQGTPVQDKKA